MKYNMLRKIKRFLKKEYTTRKELYLHSGHKYKCPLCNYSAKELAEIGEDFPVLYEKQIIGGGLRFGGCFKCGSSDRERLIYLYLKKEDLFRSGKNKSILHFAPEPNLSKKLFDFGFNRYICGDLFPELFISPMPVQKMDILNIPFEDNEFDLIICNHVLEHIPGDLSAMKELRRVLKNDGYAILQVPISKTLNITFEDTSITDPKQREIFFGQADHVRIYGQDYVQRLESCGLKVKRINISKDFPNYGLNSDEDIFICQKVQI